MNKVFNKQLIYLGSYLSKLNKFTFNYNDKNDYTREKIIGNFMWYITKRLNYCEQLLNLELKLMDNPLSYVGDKLDEVEILYELNARLEQITLNNE